jgi:hypothetical protein
VKEKKEREGKGKGRERERKGKGELFGSVHCLALDASSLKTHRLYRRIGSIDA